MTIITTYDSSVAIGVAAGLRNFKLTIKDGMYTVESKEEIPWIVLTVI